ncbi:hypothetical protein HPP92_009044 [Vanilla planifolia]|uniref:Uncharacterized protein n=1 Tax=Vanilla planifolia TaxID=51239 RepID=A0A835R9J5_VANPL|nr:hypothetical protein HPP92_009044 [Vanilla planifolia]
MDELVDLSEGKAFERFSKGLNKSKGFDDIWVVYQDQGDDGPPSYKPIWRNEFSYRKHTKQKEEDIVPCVCLYDPNDQESALANIVLMY